MKVIFISDVPGSGQAGDVKEVKNGYARNFLLPRELAVPASHDHMQRLEAIRKAGDERRIKEQNDLNALVELLSEVTLRLSARVGPTGRFYGAVTSTHVTEELIRLTEREFDRRSIQLENSIHEPGIYEAQVRFSYGISATLKIVVDAEGQEGAVEARLAEEAEQAEAAEQGMEPDTVKSPAMDETDAEQNMEPEAVESPGTDDADEQTPSTDPEPDAEEEQQP